MAKHDHDHGNDHHHSIGGHHHVPANFGKAFAIGIALNLAYVVGETFYGVIAHSLALLADAGHNLGDVLGLASAWLASILGQRQPSARYTYGLRRSSILATLGNAIVGKGSLSDRAMAARAIMQELVALCHCAPRLD
jgi:cobalt-zinc-cadmium efflux system protein